MSVSFVDPGSPCATRRDADLASCRSLASFLPQRMVLPILPPCIVFPIPSPLFRIFGLMPFLFRQLNQSSVLSPTRRWETTHIVPAKPQPTFTLSFVPRSSFSFPLADPVAFSPYTQSLRIRIAEWESVTWAKPTLLLRTRKYPFDL